MLFQIKYRWALRRILLFLILWIAACSGQKPATIQTTQPIRIAPVSDKAFLSIETGMHTAPIRRIAVDAEEKKLVTASHDKTARIWDLKTGKLLHILRPPIGDGAEGRLYAVAISPDGTEIALGGFTGKDDGPSNLHIYFFDAATGHLTRQIDGLPDVIDHLSYSFDGSHLAASLGTTGIRVYETAALKEVGRDESYAGDSYWVEFDKSGRLISSSYDGFVRLYDQDFKLIKKQKLPGGIQPFVTRFSPDGKMIAVGFADSTAINILNSENLDLVYAPDTHDINSGNLGRVAWSSDGQALYAGGRYVDDTGNVSLIKWSEAGRGAHSALSAAQSTIMDIRSLSQNRLAYGTADPIWGVMNPMGFKSLELKSPIVDHRYSDIDKLKLSPDGSMIEFMLDQNQSKQFSVLEPLNSTSQVLKPAKINGLDITDWRNKTNPKLNGKPLKLDDYERSRSLAIADDEQHFLLGADWQLRFYDKQGSQLWKTPVRTAWRVNISSDRRFAVAALGDGTIRWYDLNTGDEKLAYFPTPDGKDWVVWTPEGFFNASEKGKDLIGYHLNQGPDHEGQFVSVDQLSDLFFRPDLIAQRMQGDETAISMALNKIGDVRQVLASGLPPQLEWVSQEQKGLDLILKYKVKDSGGGIGKLSYRINGVEQEARGVMHNLPGLRLAEISIPLSQGKNAIELFANNQKNSIASKPLNFETKLDTQKLTKPSLYVLALGVSRYQDANMNLKFADADAQSFARALEAQSGQLFQFKSTPVLINEDVTVDKVTQSFENLAGRIKEDDVFILYMSGHGMVFEGSYHFIPNNAVYTSEKAMREASLSEQKLRELLAKIKTHKSVIFIDTCHAGKANLTSRPQLLTSAKGADVLSEKTAITRLWRGTGRAVLSAASDTQMALEGYQGHGYFTAALLDGLLGRADNDQDRQIDVLELSNFLGKRVPVLTQNRQIPVLEIENLIDFPIGSLR